MTPDEALELLRRVVKDKRRLISHNEPDPVGAMLTLFYCSGGDNTTRLIVYYKTREALADAIRKELS